MSTHEASYEVDQVILISNQCVTNTLKAIAEYATGCNILANDLAVPQFYL